MDRSPRQESIVTFVSLWCIFDDKYIFMTGELGCADSDGAARTAGAGSSTEMLTPIARALKAS